MLGDGPGPRRRLLPTQSVSRIGVWDRLHLGSVALELRRGRRRPRRGHPKGSPGGVPSGPANKSPAPGAGGAWSLGDNETNESVSGPCGRSMAVAKREPRPKGEERGLGNPHGVGGMKDYVTRAPLRKLTGVPKG